MIADQTRASELIGEAAAKRFSRSYPEESAASSSRHSGDFYDDRMMISSGEPDLTGLVRETDPIINNQGNPLVAPAGGGPQPAPAQLPVNTKLDKRELKKMKDQAARLKERERLAAEKLRLA